MNQKIRGWEPDRSAPVGISSLQLDCSFSGLVSHGATLELEAMLLVIFRQAANTVWRKKFGVGIAEHVVEEAFFFVPELVVAATHFFHSRADVDEVLEELGGNAFVDA